eukprot:1159065-Pelagomonas_calceolata.AAC.2
MQLSANLNVWDIETYGRPCNQNPPDSVMNIKFAKTWVRKGAMCGSEVPNRVSKDAAWVS